MKHPSPACFLWTLAVWIVWPASLPLHAADEPRKVLSTTSVKVGTHSIVYQRVEPPKEIAAPVVASAAATAVSPEEAVAKWNRQHSEILSLSCTVYEAGVTEVRWWAGGAEYRIVSSIDFNHLRSLGSFTEDVRNYMVFMGIGTAMPLSTQARLQAGGALLPASVTKPAPTLPANVLADIAQNGGSRYVIISAPQKAEADAFRGIDDLHHHYDAHKTDLIAAWQQSEVDRIAHEQWAKEHLPVPQDTVIQFWPGKGSRYLDAANLNTVKEAR